MKTLKTISVLLFLLVWNVNSQSNQYATAMRKNFELFSKSKTLDSLQMVGTQFERIALAEKTLWIPYYYASYLNILQSLKQKDDETRDKTLDRAQELLDQATILPHDSSECEVLQGFLHIARMQVSPMMRGAEYSKKANHSFDKAMKLNPENPRGFYMKGMTIYNTPKFFGGGKEPAKPFLEKAVARFQTYKTSQEFFPN